MELGAMFRLKTSDVPPRILDSIKKELTVKQRGGEKYGFGKGQTIVLYREQGEFIEIPRYYALQNFSVFADKTVEGQGAPFTFTRQLRAHQIPVINDFMGKLGGRSAPFGGILSAPCGTGKTVEAINILSRLGRKAIVLVHAEFLMRQWEEAILGGPNKPAFTDLRPEDIGHIQQDREEWEDKKIVLAMVETLINRDYDKAFYDSFGVVVLDECVSGDSKIQTEKGLISIADFPLLSPTHALSFNELLKKWEYRRILRWIPRGKRRMLTIRAGDQAIRCTPEHPFLTDKGEVAAGSLRPGMRVRSPAPAGVEASSLRMIGGAGSCASFGVITPRESRLIAGREDRNLKQPHHFAVAVAANRFDLTEGLRGGEGEFRSGLDFFQDTIWPAKDEAPSPTRPSAYFTGHCSETAESQDLTLRLIQEFNLHTENASGSGQNTRRIGFRDLESEPKSRKTPDSGREAASVAGFVIQVLKRYFRSLGTRNEFPQNGCATSPKRDGRGGTWMMGTLPEEELLSIRKDSRKGRSKSSLNFCKAWDSIQSSNLPESISSSDSGSETLSIGSSVSRSSEPQEWSTSFLTVTEIIEDPQAGAEDVFDLEVEGNHNFVADGFLVHNCHRHGAAEWHKAMTRFPARYRIGLSATPSRGDGLWNVIKFHIGNVIAQGDEAQKATVYVIDTGVAVHDEFYKQYDKQGEETENIFLARLLKVLCKSDFRNRLIADEVFKAVNAGRRVLVLSDRLAHLDEIERLYKERLPEEDRMAAEMADDPSLLKIGRYVGGASKADIEKAKECNLLLGTFQYAKEGLDDPGLDTLILATPKGDVIQAVGRILRIAEGKKPPIVVDIVDEKTEACRDFYNRRAKRYLQRGYDVKKITKQS